MKNSWHALQIMSEWVVAHQRLADITPAVSIFGSARLPEGSAYYQQAFELAKRLSTRGFAILSGGGPGIMCAANAGAQAGQNGSSIGLNIQLPHEQHPNPHQDIALHFEHFPTRKMAFAYHSSAYVVMPGGLGTLDELFEVITLMQTQKRPMVPVFLYGSAFWQGLITWLHEQLLALNLLAASDLEALQLVDDIDSIERQLAPLLKNE